MLVGWLVGCFGFNSALRQYFIDMEQLPKCWLVGWLFWA